MSEVPDSSSVDFLAETSDGPFAGEVLSATWLVGDVLGSGGMAAVHEATGLGGERAALKIMRGKLVAQPGALQRFLRETVLTGRVEHPAMVHVLGQGTTDDGRPYLALELLDGLTLEEVWQLDSGPSLCTLLGWFVEVLDLLGKCHEQGIVHRDLKPSNIFLTRSGRVKVLDFGLAHSRQLSSDHTPSGTALGTPSFMAPEQAMGSWEHVDERADVFSVGATLFALLSGQRLHVGKTEAESFTMAATQAVPSLKEVAEHLPSELISFVDKALQWDQRARFENANTMKKALEWVIERLDLEKGPTWSLNMPSDSEDSHRVDSSDEECACEKAFHQLEEAWIACGRGGAVDSHLDVGTACLARAVGEESGGLSLSVLPWCIRVDERDVWTPREPFVSVLQCMYSDGIRVIEALPHWENRGLRSFLTLLLEHVDDCSGADWVNLLWPLNAFGLRVGVAAAMMGATAFSTQSADSSRGLLLRTLGASGGVSTRPSLVATRAERSILLDATAYADLERHMALFSEDWEEAFAIRLACVLAELEDSAPDGLEASDRLQRVARDLLATRGQESLLQVLTALPRDTGLIVGWLSQSAEDLLFAVDAADKENGEGLLRGVKEVLERADSSCVPGCLDALNRLKTAEVSAIVASFIGSFLPEHGALLGKNVRYLRGEAGYELLQSFWDKAPSDAVESLLELSQDEVSPLRVVGDALVNGVETAAPGVLEQLEASGGQARMIALRLVRDFRIQQAKGILIRRIQGADFHDRSWKEREASFFALHEVDSDAAEEEAFGLIRRHGLLRDDSLNESRMLAAEFLGRTSNTHRSLEALRMAEVPMWWNPPVLRDAAKQARHLIEARMAGVSEETSYPFRVERPVVISRQPGVVGLKSRAVRDGLSRAGHFPVAKFLIALSALVDSMNHGETDSVSVQAALGVEAVRQYGQEVASPFHVVLADMVPFLRMSPLWVAPWVFKRLENLIRAFHDHGWFALGIELAVESEDLIQLARVLMGQPTNGEQMSIPNIMLESKGFDELVSVMHVGQEASQSSLDAAYASVLAALWEARGGMKRGQMPELGRLLRAAQLVVDLSLTERLAGTAPTANRLRNDTAARWVDSSVLAVEVLRAAGKSVTEQRNVALAGLLLALVPFDERGVLDPDGPVSMPRAGPLTSARRLAAWSLGLLIGIPGLVAHGRYAANIAYETQRRRYCHIETTVDVEDMKMEFGAVVLATAIRFHEVLAVDGGVDATVEVLRQEKCTESDQLALRFLMAVLWALPRGAVVELSTGEVGVVLSEAREGFCFEPKVELRVDAEGKNTSTPMVLDFSEASTRKRYRIQAVLALGSMGEANALPMAGSRDQKSLGAGKGFRSTGSKEPKPTEGTWVDSWIPSQPSRELSRPDSSQSLVDSTDEAVFDKVFEEFFGESE